MDEEKAAGFRARTRLCQQEELAITIGVLLHRINQLAADDGLTDAKTDVIFGLANTISTLADAAGKLAAV